MYYSQNGRQDIDYPRINVPQPVAGESSVRSSRRANKRPRHDQSSGGDERDGQKYPQAREATPSFECPFYKHDPHRYAECRGYQLSRVSDVHQHLKRKHLLVEVRLGIGTALPERVILYCARCRCLFRGIGAADRLRAHSAARTQCQITNIEQSGVMLDGEVEALKLEVDAQKTEAGSCKEENEREKWFIIWKRLFPGQQTPLSPYVEITVPRLEMESILHYELESTQGLKPEQVKSIVTRSADRIYKTLSQSRNSSSVPPQAQSSILPTTPVQTQDTTTYIHSDTEFASHTLQPQMQGFDYSSDPHYLGTPTRGQDENSFGWNNTLTDYSAPSPVPGPGAHTNSGNSFVDSVHFSAPVSGYLPFPYVVYHTSPFESTNQEDGYLNSRENTAGRHGSHC